MDIEFVKFDRVYLEISYTWLKDPEISKMIDAPTVTKKGQEDWYGSLPFRKDYYIWGIKKDGQPIGAVGLKNIDYEKGSGEYFGYIGEKQFWGMGIGTKMLVFIKGKAEELGLRSLDLKVNPSNLRAIHLYQKFGFKSQEGSVNQHSIELSYSLTEE